MVFDAGSKTIVVNDHVRPCITIDWGIDGLTHALNRRDIVVIVDALRFSSAAVTAVAHGFTIYPVTDRKHGERLAERINAVLAGRSDEPGISISPVSFMTAPDGSNKRVVLPSPNGAACAARITEEDTVFVGAFLNARAVGELTTAVAHTRERDVTVIACGEQRSVRTGARIVYVLEDAHRVFAIEDYLAAGAIIACSTLHRSAEAEVCLRSFQASKDSLSGLLRDSFSGRYLVENNMVADIEHSARLAMYSIVPQVHGGDIVSIA